MPNNKKKFEIELLNRRLELTQVSVAAEANPKGLKIQVSGDKRPIFLRELILRLIAGLERI
jgi:hypothetical protein